MKNLEWDCEIAGQARTHIEFWKSEYMKRKFLLDDKNHNNEKHIYTKPSKIIDNYNRLTQRWLFYLKTKKTHLYCKYNKDIFNTLYGIFFNIQEHDQSQNIFKDFFDEERNIELLESIYLLCSKYGYSIENILNITNMDNILRKNENDIPSPPLHFYDINGYQRFDENTLSLLRLNPCFVSRIDPSKGMWIKVNRYTGHKLFYPDGLNITVNTHKRKADFAILGNTLNPDFDINDAIQEAVDHIIWTLYEGKIATNQELTLEEKRAVIDLSKRMTFGEYGKAYVEARAIGLWQWDRIFFIEPSITLAEAIRQMRALGYIQWCEEHDSNDRRLRRYYKNASECISQGKVIGINIQKGRPPKKKPF